MVVLHLYGRLLVLMFKGFVFFYFLKRLVSSVPVYLFQN